MPLKDFVILNKVGEGAFSIVYKVKRISDNQIYALKKVFIIIGKNCPTEQKGKRKCIK